MGIPGSGNGAVNEPQIQGRKVFVRVWGDFGTDVSFRLIVHRR
jgi:hypothetical protein